MESRTTRAHAARCAAQAHEAGVCRRCGACGPRRMQRCVCKVKVAPWCRGESWRSGSSWLVAGHCAAARSRCARDDVSRAHRTPQQSLHNSTKCCTSGGAVHTSARCHACVPSHTLMDLSTQLHASIQSKSADEGVAWCRPWAAHKEEGSPPTVANAAQGPASRVLGHRSRGNLSIRRKLRGGSCLFYLLWCATCLWMMPLPSIAQAVECSMDNYFFVNKVISQCKGKNPGAMPMAVGTSSFAYDFGAVPDAARDRIALVRSAGLDTYVTCSDVQINTQAPTSSSSGHMRPMRNATSTLVPILAADSAAAATAMKEGLYDVCHFEHKVGTWVNMGIGIFVQNQLLGLEIMGIAHAGGVRPSLPVETLHPITIRPMLAAGNTLAGSDQIAVIDLESKCTEAPAIMPETLFSSDKIGNVIVNSTIKPKASGYLNYSTAAGQFMNSNLLSLMASDWYQVCLKRGGDSSFTKTGIGIHIQFDIAAVEVNGVRPNSGADISLPPARRHEIILHRIVPRLGYHQIMQTYSPLTLFSFEDTSPDDMFDNHCGQSCQPGENFTSGKVENGDRGSFFKPAEGTYKYMIPNGVDTHAYTLSNITSPSLAFSILFAMQWQSKDGAVAAQGQIMSVLAPYKMSTSEFPKGATSVKLRTDPNVDDTGSGGIRSQQVELKIKGFQDSVRGVSGADTVLFNYQFERDVWYFVAITLDMAKDGVARLYVNGQREPNPTPNKFVPNLNLGMPASSFQLGPASIAAYHDGLELSDVFYGFLDEVRKSKGEGAVVVVLQ